MPELAYLCMKNQNLSTMGKEIERKFLVTEPTYREQAVRVKSIEQGYLTGEQTTVVRVRVCDSQGFLTVKTANVGAVRGEWEYEIPVADARELLGACKGRVIRKKRYIVPAENGMCWEVDEFGGDLAPLVLAEIEMPDAGTPVALPSFVGEEVTHDPRYFNSALATQV